MKLWHAYREESRWFGRPRYVLDVRGEPDAEEQALFKKHRLWGDLVYVSPAYLAYIAQAESAFDLGHEAQLRSGVRGKAASLRLRGLWFAWVAARGEAYLTVKQLITKGRSFRAHDVVELGATENAIKAGVHALEVKCARLRAYDAGDETIEVPPTADAGIAPGDWVRARRNGTTGI